MEDRKLAETLNRTERNMTWDQVVEKYSFRHSGDDFWNNIIKSSQSSRKSVDQSLGF